MAAVESPGGVGAGQEADTRCCVVGRIGVRRIDMMFARRGRRVAANVCSCSFRSMSVPDHEITAHIRSAAMAPPASKVAVDREVLIEALEELLQQRSLLRRLGDDLRTVARSSPTAVKQ